MVTLQTDTRIVRVVSTSTMAYSGSDSGSTAGSVMMLVMVLVGRFWGGATVLEVVVVVGTLPSSMTGSAIVMSCVEMYDDLASCARAQVMCRYQSFDKS